MTHSLTGAVIVTGTDTGVGKTITTAAIAAAARASGRSVTVIKAAQTGEDNDAATVEYLAAPDHVKVVARYPGAMSPFAAARRARLPQMPMDSVMAAVASSRDDLILVEGAGGLLVPMGENGWTVADLCLALDAPAVVVCRSGLGTINHTTLTLEALERRRIPASLVVGELPSAPDAVVLANIADLTTMAGGLAGILPEAAEKLSPEEFRSQARDWLAPHLYGN